MTTEQHPEILNPDRNTLQDSQAIFTYFPLLPLELRLEIWKWSLRRNRFLEVSLTDKEWDLKKTLELPSTIGSYRARFQGHQIHSKLLRTCAESRQAALEFYRAHIRCELHTGRDVIPKTKPGIIYINPEYDVVYISSVWKTTRTMLQFLHHMKVAYDPRGVGLLNLAVDIRGTVGNDLDPLQPDNVDPKVRASVRATLSQLREVFLINITYKGRVNLDPTWAELEPGAFYNRSLPIWTKTPYFDRLACDPRPITKDLKKSIYPCLFAPEPMLVFWEGLLQRWGVDESHVKYSFAFAFKPIDRHSIYNREDGLALLRYEATVWSGVDPETNRKLRKARRRGQHGAGSLDGGDDDLPEPAVSAAFGFWLFPATVLTEFRRDTSTPRPGQTVDLSGHWPELALASL